MYAIRNADGGARNVAALQVDYTHPLHTAPGPSQLTLRAGGKVTYAHVDAELAAMRRVTDSEEPFARDPGLSNRFVYRERIAAGCVADTQRVRAWLLEALAL